MNKTPLHAAHLGLDARMVDFGGWEMPINYGSQIDEHHFVRRDAGMFDVSHMTVVDLRGAKVRQYLSRLLANDVAKLGTAGKALYSCMLNERGGVLDDLIVYFMDESWFRLVVNAATRDTDLPWIQRQAKDFAVAVVERPELAMIAVQGPSARQAYTKVIDGQLVDSVMDLNKFSATKLGDCLVARTGYTGEDGFEIMVPDYQAVALWDNLLEAGVKPCGLGARDTLRLEAGMHLYGQDMNQDTTPLEVGLDWTVAMADERDFIGRAALSEQQEAGVDNTQVGLVLTERGVPRHDCTVIGKQGLGVVTSGSFSPTIDAGIALARVPRGTSGEVQIEVRNRKLNARVVAPPFVRDGQVRPGIVE